MGWRASVLCFKTLLAILIIIYVCVNISSKTSVDVTVKMQSSVRLKLFYLLDAFKNLLSVATSVIYRLLHAVCENN